jgi:hypothetical protein
MRALRLAGFALLYLAIAVGVTELALRLLHPEVLGAWSERSRFYAYDARLGWKGVAGASGTFARADFRTSIRHDALGFRNDSDAPPTHPSVILLGDSYVWGYGVDAPALVSTQLAQRMAPRAASVRNLGLSGYGSDQELLVLDGLPAEIPIDWVFVVVSLPSDLTNNTHAIQYGYAKPYYVLDGDGIALRNLPVPADGALQRLRRRFVQSTALGAILQSTGDGPATERDAVELTARILRRIAEVSRARGARATFVINPTVETRSHLPWADPQVAALTARLQRDGLDVLDLAPLVRELGAGFTLPNDAHWSVAAHARIAQLFADHMRQ